MTDPRSPSELRGRLGGLNSGRLAPSQPCKTGFLRLALNQFPLYIHTTGYSVGIGKRTLTEKLSVFITQQTYILCILDPTVTKEEDLEQQSRGFSNFVFFVIGKG